MASSSNPGTAAASMALRGAAAAAAHGPCILDCTEDTILTYAQGSFSLIERDLSLLQQPMRERALAYLHRQCDDEKATAVPSVPDAFAVRRELISLKKVCLNAFELGMVLEKELQQLATFHYYDTEPAQEAEGCTPWSDSPTTGDIPTFAHKAAYTQASRLLQRCRGALNVVHDSRRVTKLICSTPRHPSTPRLTQLASLLEGGLSTHRTLAEARAFIVEARAFIAEEGGAALRSGPWPSTCHEVVAPDDSHAPAPAPAPATEPETADGLAALAQGIREQGQLDAVSARWVAASLVARGGWKAQAIVRELRQFHAVLRTLHTPPARSLVPQPAQAPGGSSSSSSCRRSRSNVGHPPGASPASSGSQHIDADANAVDDDREAAGRCMAMDEGSSVQSVLMVLKGLVRALAEEAGGSGVKKTAATAAAAAGGGGGAGPGAQQVVALRLRLRLRGDRLLRMLEAAAAVGAEATRWVEVVCGVRAGAAPLFVAANLTDTVGRAAMVVPQGFGLGAELRACRAAARLPLEELRR
jgi:hypothetical protein